MSKSQKSPPKTAAAKVTAPLDKKTTKRQKNNPAKQTLRSDLWTRLSSFFGIGKSSSSKAALMMGGIHDAWRYQLIWFAMLIFFFILILRAGWVQVIGTSQYEGHGNSQSISERVLYSHRGLIFDRLGTPLAANAPLVTVFLDPYAYALEYHEIHKKLFNEEEAGKKERLQRKLQKMDLVKIATLTNTPLERLLAATNLNNKLDYGQKNIDQKIKESLPSGNSSRRMVLLNRVPPKVAEPALSLGLSGFLGKEVSYQRYYLQAEPSAQLIGYTGRVDNRIVGKSGLEVLYNSQLAGIDGKSRVLRDNNNQPIAELEVIQPLVEGKDLHLTLDARLQYVLYKELEQVGRLQSALSSSGIVVDVQTGEVLAMASWPSFNSNNLKDRDGSNERNRPVMDFFEPGSVVKPFTVAAALESGKYNRHSLLDTNPGSLKVGRYTIKDGSNHGVITLDKLIQKSSNVASVKIALSLPASAITDMQMRFGLGQKTALDLSSEVAGKVLAPRENNLAARASVSYGYGQEVTLAQLAQAYATLGNQGVMQPLYLVKDQEKPESKRVISSDHAQQIVGMMELVTEEGGTGRRAAINGYRVAGKSGTSRRNHPEGGYYKDQHRAIFAGMAPASNPRFVVAILVEDPRRNSYAGQVSAPVFANVMKEALRLYNVPYDKPLYVDRTQATKPNNL